MTLRFLSSTLCALALMLTGCRDGLVDSNTPSPESVPVAEYPDAYFKGPTELTLGSTGSFRVENVDGAAEYRWTFNSTTSGQLQGTISADSQGLERQFYGTAVESGVVTIRVSVFDADGRLMAGTSKRVVISVQ